MTRTLGRLKPILFSLMIFAVLPSPILTRQSSAFEVSLLEKFVGPSPNGAGGFGIAVAGLAHFNGDAAPELLIGYPNFNNGVTIGWSAISLGTPTPLSLIDITLRPPTGGAQGPNNYPGFGLEVASLGDWNADTFTDLIVGDPWTNSAYVFNGSANPPAAPSVSLWLRPPGNWYLSDVSCIGDINGDGFRDAAVTKTTGSTFRTYVYFGSASPDSSADTVIERARDQAQDPQAYQEYSGARASSAGDVNGDGFDDFLVSDAYSSVPRAWLFLGGAVPDTVADVVLQGQWAHDEFGAAMTPLGDFNADGFDDFAIGAPKDSRLGAPQGAVFVYLGAAAPDGTFDKVFVGKWVGDRFGSALAGGMDITGDGRPDLLTGAPGNDVNGYDAGQVYLYMGNSVLPNAPAITISGSKTDLNPNSFGSALAMLGDINLDGRGEFAVGDPIFHLGGGYNGGAVFVYSVTPNLSPYTVTTPNGGESWVTGSTRTVQWEGFAKADIELSVDGGFSWSTLTSNVGGGLSNSAPVLVPAVLTESAVIRVRTTGQAAAVTNSDLSDGFFRIVAPEPVPSAANRSAGTVTGSSSGDECGRAVASVGDFNGDGFPDFAVSSPFFDGAGADAGRVVVYSGAGVSGGSVLATMNGATAGDQFGRSVAPAGDLNGDGFDDMVVGAPVNDAAGVDAGRAYIFFGSASPNATPDLILSGQAAGDWFGNSVAGAGDVNGDGYDEVLVGAPFNDANGLNAGRAYLFLGGPLPDATPDWTLNSSSAGDEFGTYVALVGDVSGDRFCDLAVGSRFGDGAVLDSGRAFLFYGAALPETTPDLIMEGEAGGDLFGNAISGIGDFDKDGAPDWIVGAPENDHAGTNAGAAYVYLGGRAADGKPDLALYGAQAGDEFGISTAGGSDVNDDGLADFVVGARHNDAAGADAGRVTCYLGNPALNPVIGAVLNGVNPADEFGSAVAMAGDLFQDGGADIVVGARFTDVPVSGAGSATVFDFNRYHLLAPAGPVSWNVGSAQSVSWLGAEPADIWLSADAGATYVRLKDSVGGQAQNLVTVQVPHLPTRFARLKLTPHDVGLKGMDETGTLFTIQTQIALLTFVANPTDAGISLSWSTDPVPGPDGIRGYQVYRSESAAQPTSWHQVGPGLLTDNAFLDPSGRPGHRYRLTAVNGLGEELELGTLDVTQKPIGLRVWPVPARIGTAVGIELNAGSFASSGEGPVLAARIFDARGRQISTVALAAQGSAGVLSGRWLGTTDAGERVSSGVYFVRIAQQGGGISLEATQRIVLVR